MAERRSEPRVFHGWKLVGTLFARFGARKTMLVSTTLPALGPTVLLTALTRTQRHHPYFVTEG
jgi:hypothetical protein